MQPPVLAKSGYDPEEPPTAIAPRPFRKEKILSADQLFAKPKNPCQGKEQETQRKLNEAIKVLTVKEPARLGHFRKHLLQVCALNHETWKFVRAETDDDHEWLPNPKQKGVLGLPVNDAMIDAWLGLVRELEAVLNGKKLVPVSLTWNTGDKGLNLKTFLDDPPARLDLDAIATNGPAALPKYLEEGTPVGFNAILRIAQVFENPMLVAYAVWFN